jgi:hypothetical protein
MKACDGERRKLVMERDESLSGLSKHACTVHVLKVVGHPPSTKPLDIKLPDIKVLS